MLLKTYDEAGASFATKFTAARALLKAYNATVRSDMSDDNLHLLHDAVVDTLTQMGVHNRSSREKHFISITQPLRQLGTNKFKPTLHKRGKVVALMQEEELVTYFLVVIDGEKAVLSVSEAFG